MRKISRTISGARPSDGSSSISSFGLPINARASASICCSPPESVPARCSPPLADPREVVGHAVDVALQRAVPAGVGAELEVLDHGELRERAAPFRDVRDPRLRDRLRAAAQRLPLEDDLAAPSHGPRHGAERRRLARSVRAEDGDDRALWHRDRDSAQGLHRPVTGLDVPELEQCLTPRRSRDTPRSRPGSRARLRECRRRSCVRS